MAIGRFIDDVVQDPVRLAPIVVILGMAATVVTLCLPLLEQRRKRLRLHHVTGAERRMRAAAAAKRAEETRDDVVRLRHDAPKKIYAAIVERLNLNRFLSDPKLKTLLNQAGFRSPAAATQLLAMRVLVAAGSGVLAFLYPNVVLNLGLSPVLNALAAAGATAIGWMAPIIYLRNRFSKRRTEVKRNWPDAMDLLLICAESGMSIEAAFRRVAEEMAEQSPVLSEELSLTTAELSYLQDRPSAYRRLAARTGVEEVKAIATTLIQSEKYGTSVGQALRVLSRESRALRMQEAEKKAAALPPKLTVPMIVFFLPVLFAVIMTPAIIQIMND